MRYLSKSHITSPVALAWSVFYALSLKFSVLVSCHVIRKSASERLEIWYSKWLALHQIPVNWDITYFGTSTKLSLLFQVQGVVYTWKKYSS